MVIMVIISSFSHHYSKSLFGMLQLRSHHMRLYLWWMYLYMVVYAMRIPKSS